MGWLFGFSGLAIMIFYFAFWKVAPWLSGFLPNSEWSGVLQIAIYVLVAYFGGIGLPIFLIGVGIFLWTQT